MKEQPESQLSRTAVSNSGIKSKSCIVNLLNKFKVFLFSDSSELEGDFDNPLPKKEITLENIYPAPIDTVYIEQNNQVFIKNELSETNASKLDLYSETRSELRSSKVSVDNTDSKSIEYNKGAKEEECVETIVKEDECKSRQKSFVIGREPFDRNPYNFLTTMEDSFNIIEIKPYSLKAFEKEIFPHFKSILRDKVSTDCRVGLSKRKKNHYLPPIPERSNENNFPTGKTYIIEPVSGDSISTEKYKSDENSMSFDYDQFAKILAKANDFTNIQDEADFKDKKEDNKYGSALLVEEASDKCFLIRNVDSEHFYGDEIIENSFSDEKYFIAYSLVMPSKTQGIEFPLMLPSIQEVLLIFLNAIELNYREFFDKKILTRTELNVGTNKKNIIVAFFEATNQFVIDSISSEGIYPNDIYRIAIRNISFEDSSILCCNQLLTKPKYLCYCCYCPPFYRCGDFEIEACDCGVSNPPFCYLPAIDGCCVKKIEIEE